MAIEKFQFTKLWTNPTDFPSYEPNETRVREDMQCLHDETRDYLNNVLLGTIEAQVEEIKEWVLGSVAEAVLGEVPDLSIRTEKLANSCVTREKLSAELQLPTVSDSDEGKFLMVVNGGWDAVEIVNAGEEEY